MRVSILVGIIAAIVIIIPAFIFLVYQPLEIENVIMMPMQVKVDSTFGLNADPGQKLIFGRLLPNSIGERSFMIENNNTYPLTITITPQGQIESWVVLSENNFVVGPMGKKEVIVQVHAPDVAFGNYTGNLIVEFRKRLLS